jgi:hypothetical protein
MMKPYQVKRYHDIAKLTTEMIAVPEGHIVFNLANEICLTNQRFGNSPTGEVKFTRRSFEKFARWYLGLKG